MGQPNLIQPFQFLQIALGSSFSSKNASIRLISGHSPLAERSRGTKRGSMSRHQKPSRAQVTTDDVQSYAQSGVTSHGQLKSEDGRTRASLVRRRIKRKKCQSRWAKKGARAARRGSGGFITEAVRKTGIRTRGSRGEGEKCDSSSRFRRLASGLAESLTPATTRRTN